MTKFENCRMQLIVSHEAWYGPAAVKGKQITLGMNAFTKGGHKDGTAGEMVVEWQDLGGKLHPRLGVYDDGWAALAEFQRRTDGRFLALLESLDDQDPTPEELTTALLAIGFEDATERESPHGTPPVQHSADYLAGYAAAREATLGALAACEEESARPQTSHSHSLLAPIGRSLTTTVFDHIREAVTSALGEKPRETP